MGIKTFFNKIGQGLKKFGRFVKDKAIPFAGRIAKPILNVMGMLPGQVGMIGKIGSAITNTLTGITDKIPNKDVRDKLNNVIDKGNNGFQKIVDKTQTIVDTGQNMVEAAKDGWQNQIKPAVPNIKLKPM